MTPGALAIALAMAMVTQALAGGGLSSPELVNPCLNPPYSSMPWCNYQLPIDDRIKDMVSRMSLEEKIGSMGNRGGAIPSLGLPPFNWWSEATHGVQTMRHDKTTPWSTAFAFPITTSMSFNRTLWKKTGGQIGRESRAIMNAGNAYSTYWTPVVNLARDPRWGRNIETPGEDPYLTSEYATSFVRGFQESPDDPTHLQSSACCKHFVANEMESTYEAGAHWTRMNFDANVTMQDLVDSYMPPFQACVEKGRVSSLMCSYNAVNGVPSCANDWLLQRIARDTWGFDGYVTADCDADEVVFKDHHYTKTPEEAVRDVLHAGTDSDCGDFVSKNLKSTLDKGLVTEADVDARLSMLFRVRMRLSHFDPLGPLNKIPVSEVCSDHSKALARDGVAQAATLLKNTNATLPLASAAGSVAVIGPNAEQGADIEKYYGPPSPCDGKFWTMVDAVRQYVPQAEVLKGVPSVTSSDTSGVAAAAALAGRSDKVVLVLGTDLSVAREGMDSNSVDLPQGQAALVSAVLKRARQPVVVVMLTAVPLDISGLLSHPMVGAILHVGQPAVQTLGVGDVLFGKKVPAGRLVQTIYPSSYTAQISIFDFNMRPGPSAWPRPDCPKEQWGHCTLGTNPGRTHRFYVGTPVLPFGFGLSYTSFKYEVTKTTLTSTGSISLAPLQALLRSQQHRFGFVSSHEGEDSEVAAPPSFSVTVTNTGSRDADDVVLGFVVPPGAGTGGIPLQTLFGFERVFVPAGQSRTVDLYPAWTEFSTVDLEGNRQPLEGTYKVRFGLPAGPSAMGFAEINLEASLHDVQTVQEELLV